MELKKEDLKLFQDLDGKKFYALPKGFFDVKEDPIEEEIIAQEIKEAEELIKQKQEEAEKKALALAEKKRLAEEKKAEAAAKKKADLEAKKAQKLKELAELEAEAEV